MLSAGGLWVKAIWRERSHLPRRSTRSSRSRVYADGTLKKEVAFKLVDEEKGLVVDEWTNVDLTPLGWVDKIEFHFVCENVNAPAYFCIDDLTVATEFNY